MKLLKGKGYDQKFKLLMEKDWDYGPHPDENKTARLGKGTLRQRLDSHLMKAVLKSFNEDKMGKYQWLLDELESFTFYLFDRIAKNGTIIYNTNGIDLSHYVVLTGFNLRNRLLMFYGMDPMEATKESSDMVFEKMIDKKDKYNYNVLLIIEVNGKEMAKYFINTIGRHSLENAFQTKVSPAFHCAIKFCSSQNLYMFCYTT